MNRAFYIVVAAQFFSAIADSALLIAAIALLMELNAPAWMTPLLKLVFNASYVLLAVLAGAFADALPKGRVMFIANLLKVAGCILMLMGFHPLPGFALAGIGAAMYSPAKMGIMAELLPAEKLVAGNGWMEGSGVLSIILGTVLGGLLIRPQTLASMLGVDTHLLGLGIDSPAEAAMLIVVSIYLLAALLNMRIPPTSAAGQPMHFPRKGLSADFLSAGKHLWRDQQARLSLSVTSLFWGVGAVLQFIVLKWAEKSLHLTLDKAAVLQGTFALGVACGAASAARSVPLNKSFNLMPLGIALGLLILLIPVVSSLWTAYALLLTIGAIAGFFVVPMNAVLQHRGRMLMRSGQSIAVQNFSENLSVLTLLTVYAFMLWLNLPLEKVIFAFGMFILVLMWFIMRSSTKSRPSAVFPAESARE